MAAIVQYQLFLKQRRASLIQELGQIEKWLGYERSITGRKERKA